MILSLIEHTKANNGGRTSGAVVFKCKAVKRRSPDFKLEIRASFMQDS
jgi:hypothetical protein